jgi:cell division protein FtsI/penicillin-binding protein 2
LDAITKRSFFTMMFLVLCLGQRTTPAHAVAQDLHEQASAALLVRDFTDPDLSYLLLDENSHVIAQRWEHPERDVPVGSLVKPFLAAAYGQTHPVFPKFHCSGKKTCWLARGHGTLQISEAIAFSCNSYFHQLVANAGPDFIQALNRYALHNPATAGNNFTQITAAPALLAQAYLELTGHSRDVAVALILRGLAFSAQKGTGRAAGAALPNITVLVKTGTAPCTHVKKSSGDGFALVMVPADHPREVLLVRLHGRPGSIAAGVAGRMIAAVEGGEISQ